MDLKASRDSGSDCETYGDEEEEGEEKDEEEKNEEEKE
jgi:hypothetical protein